MRPWDIIGWILLGFSAIVLGLWIAGIVALRATRYALHVRTRDDAPKAGDLWVQGGEGLHIERVLDDGLIVIRSDLPGGSKSSWSDTPEKWRQRVKKRKLWRTKP